MRAKQKEARFVRSPSPAGPSRLVPIRCLLARRPPPKDRNRLHPFGAQTEVSRNFGRARLQTSRRPGQVMPVRGHITRFKDAAFSVPSHRGSLVPLPWPLGTSRAPASVDRQQRMGWEERGTNGDDRKTVGEVRYKLAHQGGAENGPCSLSLSLFHSLSFTSPLARSLTFHALLREKERRERLPSGEEEAQVPSLLALLFFPPSVPHPRRRQFPAAFRPSSLASRQTTGATAKEKKKDLKEGKEAIIPYRSMSRRGGHNGGSLKVRSHPRQQRCLL